MEIETHANLEKANVARSGEL